MGIRYNPKFERSSRLVYCLTEAQALASWINHQPVTLSWVAQSQRDALVRLAHSSTRIEGNPLTLPEVEALAEGKDLPVEEKTKREVLNYFAALRWIWRSAPSKIAERTLLKLHRLLTQGVLPKPEVGIYKTKPNAVFSGSRIIYHPPPPEAAGLLTRSLLSWLNSAAAQKEHTVIVASIAHHRLVSIHPFMDGNGRIARALETWLLYRRGFDTHHIFSVDEFFDHDRARYYNEIQNVRKNGDDLTSWLEYVGEGILETLKKIQVRIRSLSPSPAETKINLVPKQERILQILAQMPRIGGGELSKALGINRSYLSKLLKPLLKAGWILKEGSTRSAYYRLREKTKAG